MKNLQNTIEQLRERHINVKSILHLDDDITWITTENGAHIPLDENKKAVGGPLKGKTFSNSHSSTSSNSSSKNTSGETKYNKSRWGRFESIKHNIGDSITKIPQGAKCKTEDKYGNPLEITKNDFDTYTVKYPFEEYPSTVGLGFIREKIDKNNKVSYTLPKSTDYEGKSFYLNAKKIPMGTTMTIEDESGIVSEIFKSGHDKYKISSPRQGRDYEGKTVNSAKVSTFLKNAGFDEKSSNMNFQ